MEWLLALAQILIKSGKHPKISEKVFWKMIICHNRQSRSLETLHEF
jgi:hypothetical protein